MDALLGLNSTGVMGRWDFVWSVIYLVFAARQTFLSSEPIVFYHLGWPTRPHRQEGLMAQMITNFVGMASCGVAGALCELSRGDSS